MNLNNPSEWSGPAFLMNFPFSVSNDSPNNELMNPTTQGPYDKFKAGKQWQKVYTELAQKALVYILPGHDNLQDLPFVANIGCHLPHITDDNVILLSNFTSSPRKGEEAVGRKFFESFNYHVEQVPFCWEGEADLKWVTSNHYVGCVGSRSTHEAYEWMANEFDMEITEITLSDPKLYHLDCVYFPLTPRKALVNIGALSHADIKKLEAVTEIIPVPEQYVHQGWTNCVRLGRLVLHAPANLSWRPFEVLLAKHGFILKVFNLTEFDKSGADLSCLVMHLNTRNRA